MNNYPLVLLSTETQPDVVNRNKIIYSKESFCNALKNYLEVYGDLKIPVTNNPPYLGGRPFTAPEYVIVNLEDKVGYVDLTKEYETLVKGNDFADKQLVTVTDLDTLKYLDDRVKLGLRYTGVLRRLTDITEATNMKIICYDLLPSEENI